MITQRKVAQRKLEEGHGVVLDNYVHFLTALWPNYNFTKWQYTDSIYCSYLVHNWMPVTFDAYSWEMSISNRYTFSIIKLFYQVHKMWL